MHQISESAMDDKIVSFSLFSQENIDKCGPLELKGKNCCRVHKVFEFNRNTPQIPS